MDAIIDIVTQLKTISGIEAIVLGGSRARGTETPTSDYDIGIYYSSAVPLDITKLSEVARTLDDEHRSGLVTSPGGWGPWINGGGWLKVAGHPVDFIYRELEKVEDVCQECQAGRLTMDYQPGHPFGFLSSIYLGEAATCKILWDPHYRIQRLKSQLHPFPPKLKNGLTDRFFWEAGFCHDTAVKAVSRQDISYVAGSLFRGVMCLTLCLFALNEVHWLNEKGSVTFADTFAKRPTQYREKVKRIWQQTGSHDFSAALQNYRSLTHEVHALLQQI